jgi:hypothetical protein
VADDMMVDHPVYRVTRGANPAVIEGKDGVLAFYRSVGDAVLWHSDDRLSVDAITPARVREIHRELLSELEAERGGQFWVLEPA